MRGNRRLPLRIAPEADETLVGFLVRLAARNGREDVFGFSHAVGVPFQHVYEAQYRPFDLDRLACASGVDSRSIERLAYWPRGRRLVGFLGHRLDGQLLTSRQRKACPECLATAPRHRAIWDLTVSSICGKHHTPLISACPRCSLPLGWTGPSIDRCRCGFNLGKARRVQSEPSSCAGIAAVTADFEIATAETVDRAIPWQIERLDPAERLLLALQTGWCASGRAGLAHPDRLPVGDRDLSPFLEAGYRAIRGWPESFRDLLAQLAASDAGRPGSRAGPRALGPFLRWARTLDRTSRLGLLVSEELDWLASSRSALPVCKAPPELPGAQITLVEAAAVLKLPVGKVAAALLPALERSAVGNAASKVLVDHSDVLTLLDENRELVCRDELARLLRCGEVTARALTDGDVLLPATGRATMLRRGPVWRIRDAEGLLEDLEARAAPKRIFGAVPFSAALRRLADAGVPAANAAGRLVRDVRPCRMDPTARGLRRIMYDPADLVRPASSRSREHGRIEGSGGGQLSSELYVVP